MIFISFKLEGAIRAELSTLSLFVGMHMMKRCGIPQARHLHFPRILEARKVEMFVVFVSFPRARVSAGSILEHLRPSNVPFVGESKWAMLPAIERALGADNPTATWR